MLIFPINSYCQTIIGPVQTTPGTETTFTTENTCGIYCTYFWIASDCDSIVQQETEAVIRWDQPGLYIVELWLEHPYGEELVDSKEVLVVNDSYIEYTYDNAGNRKSRRVIIIPSQEKKSFEYDPKFKEKLEELDQQFNVYPNPVDQSVFVSLNEDAVKANKKSIVIYNLMGKVILRHQAKSNINRIDLSSIGKGIYILRLEYDGKYKECKIIKQ